MSAAKKSPPVPTCLPSFLEIGAAASPDSGPTVSSSGPLCLCCHARATPPPLPRWAPCRIYGRRQKEPACPDLPSSFNFNQFLPAAVMKDPLGNPRGEREEMPLPPPSSTLGGTWPHLASL